jgi:hypothetical protein
MMRSPFVFAVCGYGKERVTDIWLCTPAIQRGLCGRVADITDEKAKQSPFPAICGVLRQSAGRRLKNGKAGKRMFRESAGGRESAQNVKTPGHFGNFVRRRSIAF